jgi:hypothetical protein
LLCGKYEAISPLIKSRHFANTPAAALLGSATATKHDPYIALVVTVRDGLSANRRESILNCRGSNAPASLILSAQFLPDRIQRLISSISAPPNQGYEYRRSA